MTADDAAQPPKEDEGVIEPHLADAAEPVQPVAVGPGDPEPHAGEPATTADGGANAATDAATAPGGNGTDGGSLADALPAAWTGVTTPGDASLLELVDRLAAVLERSDLAELEVASGGTTIVLRSPAAVAVPMAAGAAVAAGLAPVADGADAAVAAAAPAGVPAAVPERPSVKAPLTGIYYAAPSPGAQPYVAVGNHVSAGQIIGLIEAMKLFNEIKSDLSGRVVRICAESGSLVKAKQPLIEVEPA